MIQIKGVTHTFTDGQGRSTTVLDDVSLQIHRGELVSLLGPSGCGKSTLLNLLAGFAAPTHGDILIHGEPHTRPDLRFVTIFQDYGLLPWRTVQKNIELGLEQMGMSRKERHTRSEHYMTLVGILAFRDHHPRQLSGGMQQRVAIARALAVHPEVLFMDEPFGALDAITRRTMQVEVQKLRAGQECTIVFVTHDIDEAVLLSDRIVVLAPRPGRILAEIEPGKDLDRSPASHDFAPTKEAIEAAIEPWKKNVDFAI